MLGWLYGWIAVETGGYAMTYGSDGKLPMRARLSRSVLAVAVLGLAAMLLAPGVSAQAPQTKDFFGTVLSQEDGTLVVRSDDIVVEVPVDEDTRVRLPLKADATTDELAEGDRVAISLRDDGSQVADKILVVPTKTRFRNVPGVVTAVSDHEITVRRPGASGEPITFSRTPSTKLRFRGHATELREGSLVVIVAARDAKSGVLQPVALGINVVPPIKSRLPVGSSQPGEEELPNKAVIRGVLESVADDGTWVVSGSTVKVRPDTDVGDGFAVGRTVEVEAVLTDEGTLVARRVRVAARGQQVASRTRVVGMFGGVDDSGAWIVGGVRVVVGPASDTDGVPQQGQLVNVRATRGADDSLEAREVENKGTPKAAQAGLVEIEGTFRGVSENGKWRINGVEVSVDPSTELKGRPVVGSPVKVRAILQPDGSRLARTIEGLERAVAAVAKRVEIHGTVDRIRADGALVIGKLPVKTDVLTEFDGNVGGKVRVRVAAVLQDDGTLAAIEVEAQDENEPGQTGNVDIEGVVEVVNEDGSLIVNGIRIGKEALQKIKGDLAQGASVRIKGVLNSDGSVAAREVKGENRKATQSKTEVKLEGAVGHVERSDKGVPVAVEVEGTRVVLHKLTKLAVRLREGVQVTVHAIIVDGKFVARSISARNPTRLAVAPLVAIAGEILKVQTTDEGKVVGVGVNGIEVRVLDATRVRGVLEVGVPVKIVAVARAGRIVATRIVAANAEDGDTGDVEKDEPEKLREIRIEGRVEDLTRNRQRAITSVTVNGLRVNVHPRTDVKGVIRRGVGVEIRATVVEGGIHALQVVVRPAARTDARLRGSAVQGAGSRGGDPGASSGAVGGGNATGSDPQPTSDDSNTNSPPDDKTAADSRTVSSRRWHPRAPTNARR